MHLSRLCTRRAVPDPETVGLHRTVHPNHYLQELELTESLHPINRPQNINMHASRMTTEGAIVVWWKKWFVHDSAVAVEEACNPSASTSSQGICLEVDS